MKITQMKFYTRVNENGCTETACIIKANHEKKSFTLTGESKRNPKDINNEYIGKKVAVKRAISDFRHKCNRKLTWDYFFDNFTTKNT